MTRLAILACATVLTAAGCTSSMPATPSGPTTTNTVFSVIMNAANEVPPVTNADAGATGTATITIHVTKDTSGTITATSIDFVGTLAGFPPGSTAVAAHIHPGAFGVPGAVFVSTGLTPATGIVMPAGTGSFNFTGVTITTDQVNQILANPAGYYFNVHTITTPGGAIRGQLK